MADVVRDHYARPLRDFPELFERHTGAKKKNPAEERDDPVIKNGVERVTEPHSLGVEGEIFLLLGGDFSAEFIQDQ